MVQWWVRLSRTSFLMSTDNQPQSPLLHVHVYMYIHTLTISHNLHCHMYMYICTFIHVLWAQPAELPWYKAAQW